MSSPRAALASLGAPELAAIFVAFRDALRTNEGALNRLNVYPVPDGDTGTNMALTVESVVADVLALAAGIEAGIDEVAALCQAIKHGSLMGARGNSGVILSQILRGLAGTFASVEVIDATAIATGLRSASRGADAAVVRPVEGTILTVARRAADDAERAAADGGSLLDVVVAARVGAGEALASTPDLLPALRQAGVVDAGGAGYCLLLDAMRYVLDGTVGPVVDAPGHDLVATPAHDRVAMSRHDGAPRAVDELRYEVMYFLEAPDASIAAFKDVWAGLGDSIVVVGGDGLWNCHIHTDDIGATIEAAIDIGRPRTIRVTDLYDQVHALEEERWVREATASGEAVDEPPHVRESCATAVVVVCAGDGVRRLFWSLGVQQVVTGGQTMNPSTQQLLDAVLECPADDVLILPNNKNIIPVAMATIELAAAHGRTVRVVASRSATEGLAAAMQYDPVGPIEANAAAMDVAVRGLVAGEVTRAVRDSVADIGPITEGDWLGLARDGGIVAVGSELVGVATSLLAQLIAEGHGIVTVLEGEGASAGLTRQITEWLADEHPGVVAEVHHGGQPLYPYLFGVE